MEDIIITVSSEPRAIKRGIVWKKESGEVVKIPFETKRAHEGVLIESLPPGTFIGHYDDESCDIGEWLHPAFPISN